MRAVIQRVRSASVSIAGKETAVIGQGLLLLLGIAVGDSKTDADWLAKKVTQLRIFSDDAGLMNLDLAAVQGELLVVSQFTLIASYKKGNRPSFISAAKPEAAVPLYEYFVRQCSQLLGTRVASGVFGADMQVSLVNDGPVTIIMDSKQPE